MNRFTAPTVFQVFVTTLSFFASDAQQLNANYVSQQVKEVIKKTNAAYFQAFATGDSSRLTDLYTNDCWIMPSNQPALCGPQAALDLFKHAYHERGIRKGSFI